MIRPMNMTRYTFAITILLILLIYSTAADAKHIIVIYDVSGSMIRLRMGREINTYMESEDIRRVNAYLTDLLFTDTSQQLRHGNDVQIKACESAYVGKPLYQSGDTLTYANYADQRYMKFNREQIQRDEFQRRLPYPRKLAESFFGQVSYLLRAEVEVYNELYNEADDATYWVFVTDGDIDNSGKSDPGIATVMQQHAEIESEYYDPLIFSLLVNNHVKIEVRRLQKRRNIDSIFIAIPAKPKDPITEIQLARDEKGQFISATLLIDTENSEKAKFKLNRINIEIVDQYNRPLQIVNEDSTHEILNVVPVPLDGRPPPYEFRIPFPAASEIAAPGNRLKLEVPYSYSDVEKVYSSPLLSYTAVIDSLYVSDLNNPERQVKQLNLPFRKEDYVGELILQSESPNKEAFKINGIKAYIQYKDDRKLCDVDVPTIPKRLGEPFNIVIPKNDHLDFHGNRLVIDINYEYEKTPKSTAIGFHFKPQGSGIGFPIWLLWALLVPTLIAIGFFLMRRLISILMPPPPVHHIGLTQVSETGEVLRQMEYFKLENEATLEFGQRGPDELCFDVKSSAFLYCVKKDILLFSDADDHEGRTLELPEMLELKRGAEDTVYVRCEIADETPDELPADDERIVGSKTRSDDPLDA